jgi:hypothetical protein
MPIYFIIALIIIIKLMKKYPSKHRIVQFLLLSFLFYLPVGWDVMLGRAYFYYLCHKDGGIHIYQTVELGPEYWNKDGSPKFYTEKGDFDENFSGKYLEKFSVINLSLGGLLPVVKYSSQIIDKNTNKILGEWIYYGYRGGWVINTWQPFHVSPERCPSINSDKENQLAKGQGFWSYRRFDSYIFLKKILKYNKERNNE